MAYTITGHNTAGTTSADGKTAADAIKKAVEMIGTGMGSVYITDAASGKVYKPDDFALLLLNENRAEPGLETASGSGMNREDTDHRSAFFRLNKRRWSVFLPLLFTVNVFVATVSWLIVGSFV